MPIKNADKKETAKTQKHKEDIVAFIRENGETRSAELEEVTDLKDRRVRELLCQLVEDGRLIANGVNKNATYKAN